MDAISSFFDAMAQAGIVPLTQPPIANGTLCRFACQGDGKGKRNGWAILHLDGPIPCGAFGNWREGTSHKWRSGDAGRSLTPAERRALTEAARRREAERQAGHERAAQAAQDVWRASPPAPPSHPYLKAKGLAPHGIRQHEGDLIVPLVDETFRLWNVQRISPSGFKLFPKDGRVSGLFSPLNVWMANGRRAFGPVVIGEGWATTSAIFEATGFAVAAAMNEGNMLTVAVALRKAFPSRCLIIAADWDGPGGGIGLSSARKAAQAANAMLAVPVSLDADPASLARKTDFADIPRDQTKVLICAAMKEAC